MLCFFVIFHFILLIAILAQSTLTSLFATHSSASSPARVESLLSLEKRKMSSVCRGVCVDGSRCGNTPPHGEYYCYLHGPSSRHISEAVRTTVFEQSGGYCFHCGKQLTAANRSDGRGVWEPDHLTPFSQGGANSARNLVASCKACNRERSDQGVRDFNGGTRRCEGFKGDGTRCEYQVAPGNYKYCRLHES